MTSIFCKWNIDSINYDIIDQIIYIYAKNNQDLLITIKYEITNKSVIFNLSSCLKNLNLPSRYCSYINSAGCTIFTQNETLYSIDLIFNFNLDGIYEVYLNNVNISRGNFTNNNFIRRELINYEKKFKEINEKLDNLTNKLNKLFEIIEYVPGSNNYEEAKNHFESIV